MKKISLNSIGLRAWFVLICLAVLPTWAADTNPRAIQDLLNRIGGEGTAKRFVTVVDESLAQNGKEVFVITAQGGKPCIKGSTTLAVTTGINWYLNHTARVNLTWNNLTQDLSQTALPVPAGEEKHVCNADYRYYLNYCTFSYSMSTWTWERWQQEIDWMALHGINMPLQIVGLDVVWYNLLTKDLGYTAAEANQFVAGPCFQAWWGMNNLEGWGGPNPEWWYKRQAALAQNILKRQRELGMQPVLPGYSGMVPSDIGKKGFTANNQGKWCTFTRPFILDPNSRDFATISDKYYKRLEELMGTSVYYSMDPFHEGANTSGIDVPAAYSKIAEAMTKANPESKWVIQFWQWSGAQYHVLDRVTKGRLVVLDLFSDAHTHFGDYKGHDAVYCMLANFGGRTGLFGRLTKIMEQYFAEKKQHGNIKGIGATPEAIEQVPVLYDALFELAWRIEAPNAAEWLADYATARYGQPNADAQAAWEKVRNSALNCETGLQGPHEAVLCGRPALEIGSVSSWGGTGIFYNPQDMADAAFLLLKAQNALKKSPNYSYDLTDFTRQALTDYGYFLLKAVKAAYDSHDQAQYARCRDAYLQLVLDVDELLCTNPNFMLGRWTQMARGIADEAKGTTAADREWLELNNARTLITTWGNRDASEWGGLRDYSYREWGGMMKDFYYQRWKTFFDNLDKGTQQPDWFDSDWKWAHNASLQYTEQPVGETAEVAKRLLGKYFISLSASEADTYHAYRYMTNDAQQVLRFKALRGQTFVLPVDALPESLNAQLAIDFNGNGTFEAAETFNALKADIAADAATGFIPAQLSLNDGTKLTFTLIICDEIAEARTVSVNADPKQGTVAIEGTDQLTLTTRDFVTLKAKAAAGYDFMNWTNAAKQIVSSKNPYTYMGAAAETFTANFMPNKWGAPKEDRSELGTINDYGQFLTQLAASLNGQKEQTIYTAAKCPETLFETAEMIQAPQGCELKLHWLARGGMGYCNLSAYIDLNADGDFDDKGEMVKAEGKKNTNENAQLNDYTLSILLPYTVPQGVTRIRLRFDSAWKEGYNANGAMPANAATTRMVYDVPLNITAQAATPCTVTVRSANTKQGTVDANGQPDTYTYKVGEEVVLRCYPAEGYELKCWKDKYNREVPATWADGNFLRFFAPESNTYKAYFQKSTGIKEVKADKNKKKPTFSLNGQRAEHLERGQVYVQQGRKFIAD